MRASLRSEPVDRCGRFNRLIGLMATDKKRVLCIEDDWETAALIAEELTERGYEVTLAYDGGEGFAAIFKTMPDLILCDINMRVMSGFEVLEHLTRITPHFGNMPFMFLTALTDRNNELKGRRLGADDYVTKPIDFDVLDAIIKARLAHVARTEVWARNVQLNDREIETLTWVARVHRRQVFVCLLLEPFPNIRGESRIICRVVSGSFICEAFFRGREALRECCADITRLQKRPSCVLRPLSR